jgi:hypothetical protein
MKTVAPLITLQQADLFGDCPVTDAVLALASSGAEERGAVFTKREVVDFILDLAGYTTDRPLIDLRLLEPSFGHGDFLLPTIERLLERWAAQGSPDPYLNLRNAICAVELHCESFETTHRAVVSRLEAGGIGSDAAEALADAWLVYGDFLLAPLNGHFDFVVGNPPYIRQELIADALMAEYRSRYRTIYDRADIYIPFIERSLSLLAPSGKLGFICTDRWMKNRYGAPLRQLITENYFLSVYVDMVDTAAFHSEVSAYPAITIIENSAPGPTRIARRPSLSMENLAKLAATLSEKFDPSLPSSVTSIERLATGADPWILESSPLLALVRRLEGVFPTLEEAGCKVGIGVATGADSAFIGNYDEMDVEDERKLRLATTGDLVDGALKWRGLGVLNPFESDGRLADLDQYPRFARYLETHRAAIEGRHVAKKNPANWYRTIDRIYPELATVPKLLIPDIKGEAHIAFENSGLYPHHNLYYITSTDWDLKILQAVLLSGIAHLFVSLYSTKMRGGYLRFQAQYLRRICIPHWSQVPASVREHLTETLSSGDKSALDSTVFDLYGLTEEERASLNGVIRGH